MNFEQIQLPEAEKIEEGTDSFERQFNNPEIFQYGDTEIEIHDIQPEPEKKKSDVPVIFGLGFSATPEVYKQNIKGIVDNGRRVICPDIKHGIEVEQGSMKSERRHPAIQLRKVAAIMKALDERGIEKADVVAHSESAAYMTIAASLFPERFRNVTLVDPVGIIGEDTPVRLGVEFSREILKQVINEQNLPRPDIKEATGGVKDILGAIMRVADKPLSTIREVLAISRSDIRDMLKELKGEGKGISIIHGVEETAFPMDRVQKELTSKHVDGFYSAYGEHNGVILDPDAYNKLINHSLAALEAKSLRKKQT